MHEQRFTIHRRALLASDGLTPPEREAVAAAMGRLAELPADRWPDAGARRLAEEQPVFLLRLDDSLRVFVRPVPGGQPEILDITRREVLEQFREWLEHQGQRT